MPILFETQEGDDWQDEAVWRKVNPGWDHGFLDVKKMRADAKEAADNPSKMYEFRQYHLNTWFGNSRSPLFNFETYDARRFDDDETDLEEHPCYLGIDYAQSGDLASIGRSILGNEIYDALKNNEQAAKDSVTTIKEVKRNYDDLFASINSFNSPTPEPSSGCKGGGGAAAARQNDLEREIKAIAQETSALRLEAQALAEVSGARMAQGDALEFARTKAELLAAAQRAGVEVTPQLAAEIDTLAREYTEAGHAAELAADKIEEVQAASKAGADRVASIFEGMATGALTAKQAVGQLILELLKLSLKKRLLGFLTNAGGGGFLGGFLKILGGGFAAGGYTGDGRRFDPAGVVHKGEYVISAAATKALGVGNLDALHNAAKHGYSGGGLVGAARTASTASIRRPGKLVQKWRTVMLGDD